MKRYIRTAQNIGEYKNSLQITQQDEIDQVIAELNSYKGTWLSNPAAEAVNDLSNGRIKLGYDLADYLNIFEWSEALGAQLEETTGLTPWGSYGGVGNKYEYLLYVGIAYRTISIEEKGYEYAYNYVINFYKKKMKIRFRQEKQKDPSLTIYSFLTDWKERSGGDGIYVSDDARYMQFGEEVLSKMREF